MQQLLATDTDFVPPDQFSAAVTLPPPLPAQVFKPFAVLILTGLQTRFYSSPAAWFADRSSLEARGIPHHIYEYVAGRYNCLGGWEPGEAVEEAVP